MTIGFIGLGIMGSRMAANLQAAGYALRVHNRSRDKAEALIARGAVWADSPSEAARDVDLLVTMLSTPEAVEACAFGAQGLLAGLGPGALWIDCSTVDPEFARRMATEAGARGIHKLDAPVAGSREPAERGQLRFLVGGPAEDLARALPLFEVMGSQTRHLGDHGAGCATKLVVNLALGHAMASFAEAMALGRAQGIETTLLLDLLVDSPVVAPFLAGKRPLFESGDYEAQFPMAWMRKDLELASRTAYAEGLPLPLTSAVKELYAQAVAAGHGREDFSALLAFVGQAAERATP